MLRTERMIVNVYATQRNTHFTNPAPLLDVKSSHWLNYSGSCSGGRLSDCCQAQSHTRTYTRADFSILSCGISHTLVLSKQHEVQLKLCVYTVVKAEKHGKQRAKEDSGHAFV